MNTTTAQTPGLVAKFPPWVLDLLAITSGGISLVAFAPFHLYPIMVGSMAMAYLLWSQGSLGRAVWRGWLFGLGAYGVGMIWLFAIARHVAASDGVNPVVFGILTGILLLVMLAPLLIAWGFRLWLRALPPEAKGAHILAFATTWVFIEWLRSWLFTGFPLLQPGYAFIDTSLASLAPVLSVLGVTFFVALFSGSIANLALSCNMHSLALACGIGIAAFTAGFSLQGIAWTNPDDTPLRVRLVHGQTDQHEKYKRYKVIDTVKEYIDESLALPTPDLVVWPESSVAFALRDVYHLIREPARQLKMQGASLLMGGYVGGNKHTRNVLIDAADLRNQYAKRHLVPYGEYTPGLPWLDFNEQLPQIAMNELEAGEHVQPLLRVGDIPVAATICFENLFGHEQRHDWLEARMLIQVSDLAWFTRTWAADHLLQVSQMRARESGKPLLQSTNHGITAIIDHQGRIVKAKRGESGVIDGEIRPRDGVTPYSRFADWPIGILIALSVAWLIRQAYGQPLATANGAAVDELATCAEKVN